MAKNPKKSKGERKPPTAKQLAARAKFARDYGGKKGGAARSAPDRASRPSRQERMNMASDNSKKGKKTGGSRRRAKTISLTAALPAIKIGKEVIFGRQGASGGFPGVVNHYKATGSPVEAGRHGLAILSQELVGINPVRDGPPSFSPNLLMENVGLALAGKAVQKVGSRVGLTKAINGGFRAVGAPIRI